MDNTLLYLYVPLAFLIAGTVKGLVGIGLPTTVLSLLTLTLEPRLAIAMILTPMLLTNAWQVHRMGEVKRTAQQYWPFAATLFIGVGVTVFAARNVNDAVLLGALGGAMLLFVAVSASKWAPHIPQHRDRLAQLIAGSLAGLMGGLTAVWAPPMALYLAARQGGKNEFVRATGLLIFFGSMPLIWGYLRQGYLTWQILAISLALLVPTFAGFALGERLRNRMSEVAFKRILLVFFALMGLNLIRRALM